MYSTITTASAPRGTGPPVAIAVAVPVFTGSAGATPHAITSSFSGRRTGTPSVAEATSAERTANPSTLERSNGGTSIGATTSSTNVRPSAVGNLALFAGQVSRKQRCVEALKRLLTRQNGQELSLISAVTAFWVGTLVMSQSISLPQHIGSHRVPAAKPSLLPGIVSHHRRGRAPQTEVADRERHPASSLRASSAISAIPTLEAILRASGSIGVWDCRPDNRSNTGTANAHHAPSA